MRDIILKIKSDVTRILNKKTIIYAILIACVLCSGVSAFITFEPSIYKIDSYELTGVSHYADEATVPEEDIDASYKISKLNLSQETKSEIRNKENKPIEIRQKTFSYLKSGHEHSIALIDDSSVYLVGLDADKDLLNDSTTVKFLVYVHLFYVLFMLLIHTVCKDLTQHKRAGTLFLIFMSVYLLFYCQLLSNIFVAPFYMTLIAFYPSALWISLFMAYGPPSEAFH